MTLEGVKGYVDRRIPPHGVTLESRSGIRWMGLLSFELLAVVGLVALAAALRFYHLGSRSFWLDEVLQAITDSVPLSQVPDYITFNQAPLFYAITGQLGGIQDSEWMLRMPSAIAGVLAVGVVYWLGREVLGRRVAWLAAVLTTFLPFGVWYSQEARAYALLMLLSAAQILFVYRAVTRSSPGDWIALSLVTALNLYTHWVALFVTGTCAAFVALEVVNRAFSRDRPWLTTVMALDAVLLVILACLPRFKYFQDYIENGGAQSLHVFGRTGSWDNLRTLLEAFDLTGLLLALAVLGVVLLLVRIVAPDTRSPAMLLLLWILVPAAFFAYKLRLNAFALWPRYLSFLYPDLAIMIALGGDGLTSLVVRVIRVAMRHLRMLPGMTDSTRSATAVAAVTIALLASTLPALVHSYSLPKDDYRDATSRLVSAGPELTIVLAVGRQRTWLYQALPYYCHRLHRDMLIIDDAHITSDDLEGVRHHARSPVWAAIITGEDPYGLRRMNFVTGAGGYPDLDHANLSGVDVIRYPGIALVRPLNEDQAAFQQFQTLLDWRARSGLPPD